LYEKLDEASSRAPVKLALCVALPDCGETIDETPPLEVAAAGGTDENGTRGLDAAGVPIVPSAVVHESLTTVSSVPVVCVPVVCVVLGRSELT